MVFYVNDEQESEQGARARQQRIEALARQIAETINAAPVEGREELREEVGELLRTEVREVDQPPSTQPAGGPQPGGGFNPFGIGIPLILMGAVLVFLFPPVGLLLFAAATVMLVWGVGSTLLARS